MMGDGYHHLWKKPFSLHVETGQGAHGGSHVPFAGDRAPMEAAMFPSQGTGCSCKHPNTTGGGGVDLCSE